MNKPKYVEPAVGWNTEDEKTVELRLSTAQAADMAGIIIEYINAIMAVSDGA